MNDLTKLKHYLDRCLTKGKPAESKFRIQSRSYNDKQNQHEVLIFYSYRNTDDLPVSPPVIKHKSKKRRLFNEIFNVKERHLDQRGTRSKN